MFGYRRRRAFWLALLGFLVASIYAIGIWYLQRSLSEAPAALRGSWMTLAGIAMLSLALALMAGYAIARATLRRVHDLTSSVSLIEQGNYTAPVTLTGDDELSVLARGLERMRGEIARREKEILRLAYVDAVTSLPNRSCLMDRLEQGLRDAARRGETLTVMLLDLDRFKLINDALGHAAGDSVLQQVALRLRELLRESDTVGRLGGDEFAIVLPGADADHLRNLARRIARALRQPLEVEGQPIDLSSSIGIAEFPEHGTDADMLVRCADMAMYVAKKNGGGYAFYNPRFAGAQLEHLSMLSSLRRAIEDTQLRAYYQPQVDLATGRIKGVEALVRWKHPTRGLLMPSEFIEYAERTGFVRMLTRWMLAITMRQCGIWSAQGRPLQVAINISVRDLMSRDFPHTVADLLKTHAVPPHLLCLEITESSFMEDPDQGLSTVRQLRALGVRVSIDDFGTGFSSLAYLKKLPVDEVKIDRSFVSGITRAAPDLIIVSSTIDLAHNLGLRVVAEGVENEASFNHLRALGCDLAQGYYISRPMRRAALEAWLQESPHGLARASAPQAAT